MNNKEVIYIDVDDDITSVIGKVKGARKSIVALVPPKRSNVLQSVVNLKLLQRKADASDHKLVFITSDRATVTLAGSLGLYVAKTLQTKPEIPTVASVLEGTDDEVESIDVEPKKNDADEAITDKDIAQLGAAADAATLPIHDNSSDLPADVTDNAKKAKKAKGKKPKIPNFEGFRKKAILIVGGILLLLLIVVIFFTITGKTTVTIHGQTASEAVNFDLKVEAKADKTSPKDQIIKATSQELQKSISQTFNASGQKNLGQKASGQMSFSIDCSSDGGGQTIPAGTTVSANGLNFTTQSSTTISNTGSPPPCVFSSGTVNVIADKPGGIYNLASQSYTVSGLNSITGNGQQMSGGTDQIVKIITQKDVDNAKAALKKQDPSDVQKQLSGQFDKDLRVLSDSFTATQGAVSVTPSVGDQASQGTVTSQYTYSELAISNDDLNAVLDYYMNGQIQDKTTQRIYKNGFDNLKLGLASKDGASSLVYHVDSTGYIGPQFDEDAIKQRITGKKYGQIVSTLQQIKGVNSVDVSFTPFWAHSAGSPQRIQINLDVSKSDSGS